MPLFTALQVPPPENWKEFEKICWDLWKIIWEDPNAQRNGRDGQSQHGVDIYGRPNQGETWSGVQCKGKDNYANKKLTSKEVRAEVEKAKLFEPRITQFIIATSGPKDAPIEELARKITQDHIKKNLFTVNVFGWSDIVDRIADYPDLIEKHYPGFGSNIVAVREGIDEIKQQLQTILPRDIGPGISTGEFRNRIDATQQFNNSVDLATALIPEYHNELDHSRDLLEAYKPKEALAYLEKLKQRIWAIAPPLVKYRILTNLGSAKIELKQEHDGASLLIEALQYNPDDEKAQCNSALGHMLLGLLQDADQLIKDILVKNPASIRAYSILVQIKGNDDLKSVIELVPPPYRTSPPVAFAIGQAYRKKGDLTNSLSWFQTAVEKDQEDRPELKATLGEIIIQSVLANPASFQAFQLDKAYRGQIQYAVELLTQAWDKVEQTDLRGIRASWALNRGLARKLLGDMGGAVKDTDISIEIGNCSGIK